MRNVRAWIVLTVVFAILATQGSDASVQPREEYSAILSNISNAGGHTTNFSPLRKGVEIMSSIYRMPAAWFRARA